MEEQPRDEQAEPNDEAEETYDVHNGEPADASSISLWKLDTIPMVKKVRVKKIVRRGPRVLITLLPRGCHSTFTQMNSMITKVSR